jgi:hypothetical protein
MVARSWRSRHRVGASVGLVPQVGVAVVLGKNRADMPMTCGYLD